jgi:AcrR family transcriptional regulator
MNSRRYRTPRYISTVAEIVRPRGRRPGPSTTRDDLLAAARARFATHGYDGTRLRDVAADAGVDVALVHYHFRSKDGLFAAALEMPVSIPDVIAEVLGQGSVDDLGPRMLRRILALWDDGELRPALAALVRSEVVQLPGPVSLGEFIRSALIARIAETLDAEDAELRAALFGSQLFGLLMYRYVFQVEPAASQDTESLVELVGPNLQRYLTGDR